MPHEVIMPALGMAQDTGLIVSWQKSTGDAVASGDVLFEVETDKATMEVEAVADGFLSQVRYQAGAEVPVGEVIAVIVETAEAVATHATPAASAVRPAGNEVIMPALGMTQDTGLIVTWHKAPGDAVAADDILFEVETDKSTVEVEAGFDGYVAALLAEAGEEAPVGDVIALISTEKPEKPTQTRLSDRAASAPKAAPPTMVKAPEKAEKAPVPAKKPMQSAARADGPILASPKVRRLALEQGLDLARLVVAGYPQPYHVADLETLKALPADAVVTGAPVAFHITARVSRDGFLGFQSWLENAVVVSDQTIFVAFAAASLRTATGAETVIVRGDQPTLGLSAFFTDPDLPLLSKVAPGDEGVPSLIVRDLTASRITAVALGAGEVPVLTIVKDGDSYVLTLDFAHGQLGADIAIQLLDGFAERLDKPLRHLL